MEVATEVRQGVLVALVQLRQQRGHLQSPPTSVGKSRPRTRESATDEPTAAAATSSQSGWLLLVMRSLATARNLGWDCCQ
jgi:hypothetical protein